MRPLDLVVIGGHGFQLFACAVFLFLLLSSWGQGRMASLVGGLMLVAAGVGILDAAAHMLAYWLPGGPPGELTWDLPGNMAEALPEALDRLLLLAWIGLLAALTFDTERLRRPAVLIPGAAIGLVAVALGSWGHLLLLFAALVLIEHIYRASDLDRRWALKFLLIGLSMAIAADLVVAMERLLASAAVPALEAGRAFIHALAIPLVAASIARNPSWDCEIHMGRRAVFGGMVLAGALLYVLVALAAGMAARVAAGEALGAGEIGAGGQLVIVVLLLAVLAFALTSGRVQGALAGFVSRTFFSYRFDYRDEWARFVRTLEGDSLHTAETLVERVIFAVADLVDATGGAVWQLDRRGRFRLLAARNLALVGGAGSRASAGAGSGSGAGSGAGSGGHRGDRAFIEALGRRERMVDLTDPGHALADVLPSWLPTPPQTWILLPLHHRGRLFGIMVLARRRTRRGLDREERELLSVVAREAASYLAEDAAARRLSEAERFESFNRRFAFVMHDVKNVAAQLSLTLGNARNHRGNAQFYDDMVDTLEASVSRMNSLISRIREGDSTALASIRLDKLVSELPDVQLSGVPCRTVVRADPARLRTVLENIVDNARESRLQEPEGGDLSAPVQVRVRLRMDGAMASVEVSDDGPGMDRAFIEDGLFEPFRTTKPSGFGLGMADAKEAIESMGGQVEVESEPGSGSTIRVLLPVSGSAAA